MAENSETVSFRGNSIRAILRWYVATDYARPDWIDKLVTPSS